MSRTTIDFGIDLGTTNSAIAVLKGTVPEVIKNNLDADITPSAVSIDKRGQVRVGERAKSRMEDEEAGDDSYVEFKRRMGTDHKYEFKSASRILSPEEMSAEVLKDLKGNVQQQYSEDIQSCVITVPAIFRQNQCAATIRAGQLAGFTQCPLLQEPVAAALAYGFQSQVHKEYWLVYDFGGGTFDAAIIKAEDGSISVVNHGGDNYLGGSDFDLAIMDQLIIPELQANYNLPDFNRSNKRWRRAMAVIKRATEEAKITLSRSETAFLERCRICDADGKAIEVDFKLTRSALVEIVQPIIARSVAIVHRVLAEKSLSENAIEKVILVGGPTRAQYFRTQLQSQLKIKLDNSVDPLTVVARGAAVFAGTQRVETSGAPKVSKGEFAAELAYKPVGADEDPTVQGKVTASAGGTVDGFTIEFVDKKTLWRSGRIPLKSSGRFKVNLLAEKGSQNVFGIELLDPTGSKQTIRPDSLAYTIGLAISEQPFCNDVAVALTTNDKEIFFKKGDAYPATRSCRDFKISHGLHKGESGDMLRIPIVEGNEAKADWNRRLGELKISGTQIRRDVPAGSDLEVTLHAKGPGAILVKAYLPLLDEEFEAVIEYDRRELDIVELIKQFASETQKLKTLRKQADEADDEEAGAMLNGIPDINEIEELLETAKGDPDSGKKAEERLVELRMHLDKAEDLLKWPALVAEANKTIDELDDLIAKHGDKSQREQAGRLREQIQELIDQKRTEPLRKKIEQINESHYEILFAQPGWWIGYFNFLVSERSKMRDQAAAERLINQCRGSIDNNNLQGLRAGVVQLLGLLPRDVQEEAQRRGFVSGVSK